MNRDAIFGNWGARSRARWGFVAGLAVAVSWVGLTRCATTQRVVDDDAEAVSAVRVAIGIDLADSLDHGRGDQVDWKEVYVPDPGDATAEVIIGNPFGTPHGLEGVIAIYPASGPPAVDEVAIEPGEHAYTLSWESEGDATYLFMISARAGASDYRVRFGFDAAPDDPCATVTCEDGQACEEGECVATEPIDPTICEPVCGRNQICVDNACEAYCGGGCKRGEYCHRPSNSCRPHPCHGVRCGAGEKCVWGRCQPRDGAADEPAKEAKEAPAPAPGHLDARIVSLLPSGSNTTLVLDRGRHHGVKRGMSGTIPGVGSFTVREVYSFRSQALFRGSSDAIGDRRAVRITLK